MDQKPKNCTRRFVSKDHKIIIDDVFSLKMITQYCPIRPRVVPKSRGVLRREKLIAVTFYGLTYIYEYGMRCELWRIHVLT